MDSREIIWEAKSENVIKEMLMLKNKYGIDEFSAIELYGGDGHTLSNKMAEQSQFFIGYEINSAKEKGFKQNIPNGEFRCKDSVDMMITIKDEEIGTYNLVSMDAPICIYGNDYCEHFEIIRHVYKLLALNEKTLCVFPVVAKPYDTDKMENAAWLKRREIFYGTKDLSLDLNKTLEVYDAIFRKQNLKILERRFVCREFRNGVDWMYEYMYILEK